MKFISPKPQSLQFICRTPYTFKFIIHMLTFLPFSWIWLLILRLEVATSSLFYLIYCLIFIRNQKKIFLVTYGFHVCLHCFESTPTSKLNTLEYKCYTINSKHLFQGFKCVTHKNISACRIALHWSRIFIA